MKSPWLNAVVLAVALAASACGPTDETQELEQGNVEQQLPMCDENGVCPTGYYCDGSVCRRGLVDAMLYACTADGRCPTGYYCDGSVCRRELAAQ
ncbi:MAG TPA: hypothetical protein VFZ09_19875 [Archangium sp.]|uniref:hypothetical protein n=1 Tax=Archangium sp. TaxID=1872627 RepID=UPI002E30610F|nr:hypothetical protein [Archangium sp.]HEX5748508.1 hypothetical protein [Archangium sp.]